MNVLAPVRALEEGIEPVPNVLAVPLDELIVGFIAFAIVFGALAKLALPKIRTTLAERADTIEGGIRRAEAAQEEAQQVLAEYKAQLAQAREEAASIRTQAQAERNAIIEEARQEARVAAQQVAGAAESQIAAERSQAIASLTQQIGELSVNLAGKIVNEALSSDARVSATVDAFLADLEGQAAR
jgi:F-type H+-transporting ATPase subunit b